MLPPLIQRPRRSAVNRARERGVTMALVALAIFSIIAMAALSIDIGTLYQASAEAQRSADAAALAAARVLSLSGMTGDPTNSSGQWTNACAAATLAAQAVGSQNTVGGAAPTVATPTYAAADGSGCTSTGNYAFGVNPMVTVKVTQSNLPTYFSRIWGSAGRSVSATATAEVFNPSNSGSFGGGEMVPVQPRCVKPWIVPNRNPLYPSSTCSAATTPCNQFVTTIGGATEGTILNGGITYGTGTGVIGETFNLVADCSVTPGLCTPLPSPTPQANAGAAPAPPGSYLQYLPGQVLGTPLAAPSCGRTDPPYTEAIAGCDQSTPYQCGVQASIATNPSRVDLTENPYGATGDTATAAACLSKNGDTLSTTVYPYQITSGPSNPLASGSVVTSSNSIVSLPIYDDTEALNGSNNSPVTIVGFLQVFINSVDSATSGYVNVTVLNVAGCGESVPNNATYINGTSPVPVRLITAP
jgi:Flp pilus assembly protein TadG